MNKKKSLLLSIIIVLILGLIITSGSFAYFQWSLGYASGTSVNVTIEHGGVTMHIESDAKEFVGLYPTKVDDATDCDRARYGDALVTIVNKTGTMAIPSFKLKVKVTKGGSDALTKAALEHIRYTVVPITTTVDGRGKPVKGTETSNCSVGVSGSAATGNKYDVESSWSTFGMKFESVSTAGAWSHIPVTNDYVLGGDNKINSGYLPRQYNTTTETVQGITFKAPQYSTTYQYFRVYVWLDEGYTTTTIGTVVSDPLQNAKIEVMWSEESMVEQVTGSGTAADYPNSVPMENSGEVELAAGLYDVEGNLTNTWDELVENNMIEVNGTTLVNVSHELVGKLIILDGITKLSSNSFSVDPTVYTMQVTSVVIPASVIEIEKWTFEYNFALEEVTFEENSQLTTIGEYAFRQTGISNIELPASVTTIGAWAFIDCSSLNSITFKGTMGQWNAIEFGEYWDMSVPAIEVICSDGVVTLKTPGLYDEMHFWLDHWDTLVELNRVLVSGTKINSVTDEISGKLVIPNEITVIGDSSFSNSNISEVRFGRNSNLTTIEDSAFHGSILEEIVIPSSVEYIGSSVFDTSTDEVKIYYKGTKEEWENIEKSPGWNYTYDTVLKIICIDGTI